MNMKNEKLAIIIAGIIIGLVSASLVFFGNPINMGYCIACFLRDTTGALGLHTADPVRYIRPEIIGLVLGSFIIASLNKEISPRGGSSPLTRFVLGFFVMIGCLMFLGCPFRMILRIAGGDLNALVGLLGFALGIFAGTFFLKKGYSLKRTYKLGYLEGRIFVIIQLSLLLLLICAPGFIYFTKAGEGPGAIHAPIILGLLGGLIVGALVQRTRLCMVGGIRDIILFKETKLLLGFISILISAFIFNLILGAFTGNAYFKLGFAAQPIAHSDGLWNFLGLLLAGFACVLLGGCPLRQLVLSGEGNTDSVITVFGLMAGAAFAHNFSLAANAKGPTPNGKAAVLIGIAVVFIIALANTFKKEN